MPFASLPGMVPKDKDQVLINLEPILTMDESEHLVFLQGKCDEVIDALVDDLGWREDFDAFVKTFKIE